MIGNQPSQQTRSHTRTGLALAFSMVLGVCVVLAALLALSAWWVRRDLKQITQVELPRVDAAMEMEINTLGTGLAVAQFLYDQDNQHLERIAKDRADFNRAWEAYHRLAGPGTVESELADQAQELYEQFCQVGDELIATDRRILAELKTVGDLLTAIDNLLDEKLQPTADSDELRLLMDLEIDVNEMSRRFNAYLTTADEAALSESLTGDEQEFRQDLAALQSMPLSQEEQGWAQELERLFEEVVAGHATVHQDKQLLDGGVEEFGRLRIALDDLLDDSIQQRAVEDIRSASSLAASRMKVFTLTAVVLTVAALLLLAPILRVARKMSDTERRLREREHQLRHDALHDSLTGLSNRALLNDRIEQCIERAKRHRDYRFALLFLDLDRFKVINDSLGHTVGDQLLVAIAKRFDACLRSTDTLARPDREVLARLGGDEFVILLEDLRDDTDASRVAERILAELSPAFQLAGHEITASASIGIALSGTDYDRADYMLRDADTAMYHAKAAGRSRYQVFDKPMHERAVKHLQLESDLRRALERQQFELHYQPIVSLKTARITGFEALIRWNHPKRGLVSPADFIPLAEETGLIVPIGRWVLHEACRQLRAWQEHCPPDQSLSININISKRQVSEGNLARDVTKVLRRTGIDSRCLKLEITETVIMENPDSIMAVLGELKELGVELHMDDFGTGSSSLTHLHHFPLDVLKIDRAFLENLQGNLQYAAVVHAVVTLAHNLNMEVTAEGIETSEQLAQILALDCDYGQGFLFSKPLGAAEAEAVIGKQFLLHQAA
ncbi:MAG: EAL domain-containing protein [Planctomycetes bacterium]|nr:EAL domain-containing protein [Planctomycetota bacterium]